MHKADGTTWVFWLWMKGIFFSDVQNDGIHILVNTVDKIKSKYNIKEYSDDKHKRSLQDIIGRPSTRHFITM